MQILKTRHDFVLDYVVRKEQQIQDAQLLAIVIHFFILLRNISKDIPVLFTGY